MTTTRVLGGAPSEAGFGFAQAVAVDGKAWVAGQVGRDNATGEPVDPATLEAQLRRALGNVADTLAGAGLSAERVTSLSVYLTVDLAAHRETVVAALREALGASQAIVNVVQIAALARPDFWVEVLASATIETGDATVTQKRVRPHAGALADLIPARGLLVGEELHLGAHFGFGADYGDALGEALADLAQTLAEADLDLRHVVSEQVHVLAPVGDGDFARLAEVHRAAFGEIRPAASVLIVGGLPAPGARVMVTGVARRDAQTDAS